MEFIQPKDKSATGLHEKVARTAVEAARRKFSPEGINRLDKVVGFHPLKRTELDEVLEIELRPGFSAARGGGPEIRSPSLKTCNRAECGLPNCKTAGHRPSEPR